MVFFGSLFRIVSLVSGSSGSLISVLFVGYCWNKLAPEARNPEVGEII